MSCRWIAILGLAPIAVATALGLSQYTSSACDSELCSTAETSTPLSAIPGEDHAVVSLSV